MADRPVVAFGISVLLGLAGLGAGQGHALLFSPCHQRRTDIFWPIVDPDRQGFAAPFDVEEDQDTVQWGCGRNRSD